MSGFRFLKSVIAALLIVFLVSPAGHAAEECAIEVKDISGDFVEKGYAVAKMDAVFKKDGQPVGRIPVSWEIVSVDNRSEALPVTERNRIRGLRWEHPSPSGKTGVYPSVTDSGGRACAVLTDILGERIVTVAAIAGYEGQQYRAEQTVVFGSGPLSLFTAPLPAPVTWLELYEICNGKPYTGNPSAWQTGMGFVGGDKMPSLEQMQSVSVPSEHNRSKAAFAAAAVAGWPMDRRYWNGRAVMKGRASHIDILKGTHHGWGGNNVNAKEYGVCLR